MPFDAQHEHRRINRTLSFISRIQDEMADDGATVEEAEHEAEHCREEAEWIRDEVKALRNQDDLSRSDKAALTNFEKEVEELESREDTLTRATRRIKSKIQVDMTRPLDEIEADLKEELRRLKRYVAA